MGSGGKTGMDGHALELTTLGDILVNEIMDEVLGHGGVQLFGHVVSLLKCSISAVLPGDSQLNSYFTRYIQKLQSISCRKAEKSVPFRGHPTTLMGLPSR